MVTSKHYDIPWEVKFYREEENADLDTVDSSVDIIAKEQIIQRAGLTCLADHVQQVCILAVDITDNTNRLFNLHEVRLIVEHLKDCQ